MRTLPCPGLRPPGARAAGACAVRPSPGHHRRDAYFSQSRRGRGDWPDRDSCPSVESPRPCPGCPRCPAPPGLRASDKPGKGQRAQPSPARPARPGLDRAGKVGSSAGATLPAGRRMPGFRTPAPERRPWPLLARRAFAGLPASGRPSPGSGRPATGPRVTQRRCPPRPVAGSPLLNLASLHCALRPRAQHPSLSWGAHPALPSGPFVT